MNGDILDTFLVGYVRSEGNEGIMTVGKKQKNGQIEIVSVFHGDEAAALYLKLTSGGELKNDNVDEIEQKGD